MILFVYKEAIQCLSVLKIFFPGNPSNRTGDTKRYKILPWVCIYVLDIPQGEAYYRCPVVNRSPKPESIIFITHFLAYPFQDRRYETPDPVKRNHSHESVPHPKVKKERKQRTSHQAGAERDPGNQEKGFPIKFPLHIEHPSVFYFDFAQFIIQRLRKNINQNICSPPIERR